MARTKNKARKNGLSIKQKEEKAAAAQAGPSSAPPSVEDLIDKAHTLLAQSDFELASKFLTRALEVEPSNLEARELIGLAELEGGDPERGREHLLKLFPPHTESAPSHPAPYFYLAQCADSPQEALGYYSTGVSIVENLLKGRNENGNGKAKSEASSDEDEMNERKMAVTALVAMVEIWMSDLCFEEAAPTNCDSLIARALSISPDDPEARLSLASIRMSQSKFEEAKDIVSALYLEVEGKEPFDESLPALPARLLLTRLLLEHSLHLEALDVLSTVREEDSLNVEGAYLEGWALYLRAEALEQDPSLLNAPSLSSSNPTSAPASHIQTTTSEIEIDPETELPEEDESPMTASECYAESMRSLVECAKLFTEQDYEDEGIGGHVAELLEGLEGKGIKPAALEDGEEWEDEDGDVAM